MAVTTRVEEDDLVGTVVTLMAVTTQGWCLAGQDGAKDAFLVD
jgi:hypothetical protein